MSLLTRPKSIPTGCGGGFTKRDLLDDVGRVLRQHGRDDWSRLLANLEVDLEDQDEVLQGIAPGRARELLPAAQRLATMTIGSRGAGLANQKIVRRLEQRARADRRAYFKPSQRLRRARWRIQGIVQQWGRRVRALFKRR